MPRARAGGGSAPTPNYAEWYASYLKQGYSLDQITAALTAQGLSNAQIQQAQANSINYTGVNAYSMAPFPEAAASVAGRILQGIRTGLGIAKDVSPSDTTPKEGDTSTPKDETTPKPRTSKTAPDSPYVQGAKIFGGTADSIGSVLDFLKLFAWIADPLNWLRAVEFLIGFILMMYGIYIQFGRSSKTFNISNLPGPVGTAARLRRGKVLGTREGQTEHARLKARKSERERLQKRDTSNT